MDKQIKVTIAVDDAAFDKAKRKVAELVQEVNRLAEATSKMGMFGGGGMRVGNQSIIPGGGSAAAQTAHQATKTTGNAGTDAMTRAVTNSAAAMKQSAQAGVSAFKEIDRAFGEFVGGADSKIRRFIQALSGMGTAMRSVQKDMTRAESEAIMPGWQARGRQLMRGQFRGPDAAGDFSPDELRAIQGPLARGVGGMAGAGMAGGLLRLGGAATAAFSLHQAAAGMATRSDLAHYQYNLASPMWSADRAATVGSIYGGNTLAIRGGQISQALAQQRAIASSEGKQILDKNYTANARNMAMAQTPVGFGESISRGQFMSHLSKEGGDILSDVMNLRWGERLRKSRLGGWLGMEAAPGDRLSTEQQERNAAVKDVDTLQDRKLQELQERQRQMDPVFMARLDERFSGATGELALARTAGISGATIRRKNPRTGKYENINSLKAMEDSANTQGYDVSEYASMRAQVGATAGRGLMGAATGSLLSMTHGGLSNAVQLFGTGAQFGGGNAFMKSLQGSIGRGGLDVTAGAQVYGAGAGVMTAGNFAGTSGEGMMSTLAGAAFGGGGAGADMLGARQVAGGMNVLQNQMLGGGLDPFQKATNNAAALQAAGGMPPSVRDALLTLDQGTMMDIVSSGQVPDWLMARFPNGTPRERVIEIVKRYNQNMMKFSLARVPQKAVAGTAVGDAITQFRAAGGDLKEFLKGTSGRKAKLAKLGALNEGLVMSGYGNRSANMGVLRIESQLMGGLDKVHGKGAHRSDSAGATARVAMRSAGAIAGDVGVEDSSTETETNKALEGAPAAARENRERARNAPALAAAAAGNAGAAAENVAAALQAFIVAIKGMTAQRSAAGPAASSAR